MGDAASESYRYEKALESNRICFSCEYWKFVGENPLGKFEYGDCRLGGRCTWDNHCRSFRRGKK